MSNFLSYRIAHKSQVERTGCLFIARSDDLAFLAVVRSTALPFESWYPDELGEQQSFTLLFFVCCSLYSFAVRILVPRRIKIRQTADKDQSFVVLYCLESIKNRAV